MSSGNAQRMMSQINQQLVVDCLQQLSGAKPADALTEAVVHCARLTHLKRGAVLFEQGDAGDELYMVMRGRLRVMRTDGDGEPRQVNEVGRFEAIGEIALVTRHSRTATVLAVRDSLLLRISRADYQSLATDWPAFALRLSNRVVSRLATATLPASARLPKTKIYTLVATHQNIDLVHFHRELCAGLRNHGETLSIDEQNIADYLRARGLSSVSDRKAPAMIASWIDELEGKARFIVCNGGVAGSRWARHCSRYADRMVLVGDTDTQKTLAALELPLFRGTRPECDFVRLHQGELNSVANMQGVLSLGRFARHHHLCRGDSGGIKRISRFLAGTAVGLVLAGGGARGLAHIGVVRALREANIPIDYVGGTSVGSIIGAFVAMGLEGDELTEAARRVFVTERPLRDYTLPVYSLIRGDRIDQLLHSHTQGRSIEDLWLNYFCVSASLTSNKCVVHDQGVIWRAIKASIALPGILPPVVQDQHLLVDGGMINNLPVDIMAGKGVGRTIAIDLQGTVPKLPTDTSGPPGVGEMLGRKLWGRKAAEHEEDYPGIFEILYRSSLVGSSQGAEVNRAIADLYLNPPVDEVGLLQFSSFDEIVKRGYDYAVEALANDAIISDWVDRTGPGVALGTPGQCG